MLNDIDRKTDLQNAQPIGADSGFPHVHAERSGALGKIAKSPYPASSADELRVTRWMLQ
jgi:hypothetical protein